LRGAVARSIFGLLIALLFAAFVATAQQADAGAPVNAALPVVELKPAEMNVWEHKLGAEDAIHLTAAEYAEARSSRTFIVNDYVEFEIVISENGRVDSAVLTGGTKLHVDEARQIELARVFKPWLRDGVPIRVKVKDYVRLLPPEQWAAEKVPFPDPWELKDSSIGLTRTACFGSCPDYTVTIAGDGTVRFSGHRFVLIPGDHVAHIKPEAVRELVMKFRDADFLSAKDAYRGNWTDNPTQTLTLTVAGRTKTVVDYVGTDAGLPLAIRNLEGEIDEVAGTARWVKGDERTLASLEEEKWPFGAATPQNVTLYTTAISTRNEPLIERFLKAGGPIQSGSPDASSPVCVASGNGDVELVERMMEPAAKKDPAPKRAVVSQTVKDQCLIAAARSGSLGMLQLWLDEGANPMAPPVKTTDEWVAGWGLLANGIVSGKAEMVRKLLEFKPDVTGQVQEQPLLTFALERGGKETAQIVELLVKAGADVNARNWMGQTPLFAAGFTPDAVKPLLAGGAELEARDHNGRTVLINQAFIEPMVRELLADGADPTATAKNGDTALKVAKQFSCPSCAALLEAALKQRAAKDQAGETAP
jgi:ankyrin repeat protein